MADLVMLARLRIDDSHRTHWEGCERHHRECLIQRMADRLETVESELERHADVLRCALEALDCCIEDSAELLSERTAQWGEYRKDAQAVMAALLERHRAVAERLRAMLRA